MPESRTETRTPRPESVAGTSGASAAETSILPPSGVNFTALPRRLSSTWRILSRSPYTSGSAGGTVQAMTSFLRRACGAIVDSATDTTSSRSKGRLSIFISPASMREMSRMPVMSWSSWSPFSITVRTYSRCSSLSSPAMPSSSISE